MRNVFSLTVEQIAAAEFAREIVLQEIAPHASAWNRDEYFPLELFQTLAKVGLMGLVVPTEHGGAGAGYTSYALVVEELSAADAGVGATFSVHAMVTRALALLGSAEQQASWLPRLASGTLAAFALTESEAGSDAARLRARATCTEGGWLLNGRKQWCTNGSYAGLIMGMFRTGEEGRKGITAFLIPSPSKGLRVERKTRKLGIQTSDTADLAFDDVFVPDDAVLGLPGTGYTHALRALAGGRIGIAAQACGILRASLEASIAFAKERRAFGVPIGSHEAIAFKIAQMATKYDAAALLTLRAAACADAGDSFTVEASMAKLFASRAACEGSSDAVQIHGGYGYTTEFPVERYYRDAKVTEIYEGTSEILQLVISRSILGHLR
jgi:alkylation response protein AidB-like acyl-CoA dehydrogenase